MRVNHIWPIEGRRALCGSTEHTPTYKEYREQRACVICNTIVYFKIGSWLDKQAKRWRNRP